MDNTPKGITIHYIDEGIDTGDIIVQKEIFFDENLESFKTSYIKLHEVIQRLFKRHWNDIRENKINIQKPLVVGSFHNIKDLPSDVDWNMNIKDYKEKINESIN
jgi:methionyl-tRNA formyltransferase